MNRMKTEPRGKRGGSEIHQAVPEQSRRGVVIKKGWKVARLEDITTKIGSGATPRGGDESYKAEGISLIRSLNVYDDGFRESKLARIDDEQADRLANVVVEENDVLLNITGASVARCCVAPADFLPARVNQHVSIIRPVKTKLDSQFLHFLLISKSYKDRLLHTGEGGSTRQAITKAQIQEFSIDYPESLAEQQRIVGLLDEAFEGIATAKANAEKNLQNARALFESHLQSVFTQRGKGWVEKTVSEIAKHSLGKMLDKAKNKGEPQPYLRNINVRWFTFDLSDLLQMPFLPTEVEKYTAVKGDVLICEGGYPGRAAIWNEDYPIHFQKALHRVRFHEPEHNKWFVYYLSLLDLSGQLKQYFSGTGIQHFTGEVLARFPIPVPPLSELRQAVAKFDALSKETQRLASLYTRKLAALEALKKSLLHQAFSGEL